MDVECTFSAPLCRYESDDLIRHLDLSVVEYTDTGERIVLGKIAGDWLPLGNVINAGERLDDVCDADSAGWDEVYGILFERGFDFRPELGIEENIDNVIFIWKSLLHPKLALYAQGVFETISTMFGSETVVAIWRQATQLSDWELAELGFRKVAGCELLYRDVTLIAAYSKSHPNGAEVDLDFEAGPEDAAWIAERWDEAERNHVDFGDE